MITKHTGELAYLLHTKRLDPRTVIVVNEIAYWYDRKEVDDAIEHIKGRLTNPTNRQGGEVGEGSPTPKVYDLIGGV